MQLTKFVVVFKRRKRKIMHQKNQRYVKQSFFKKIILFCLLCTKIFSIILCRKQKQNPWMKTMKFLRSKMILVKLLGWTIIRLYLPVISDILKDTWKQSVITRLSPGLIVILQTVMIMTMSPQSLLLLSWWVVHTICMHDN